jgi:plasminogen activator inhibitor 1 RNA-binding protein
LIGCFDGYSRPGHKDDRNTKGGRGRPPVREGKRQFERRSGTGRGKEIKKDGGGARNWGNEKNVAKDSEGVIQEDEVRAEGEDIAKAEAEVIPTEGATPEDVDNVEAPEPEKEEEKTMTLEEYLQSKLKIDNELLKPKAARSVESSEFAGLAPKVTVEENFLVMGAGAKTSRKKEATKEKDDDKTKLDLGFRVGGYNSDRRDGDRREGRGGRGSGEDRREGRGGRGGRDGRGSGERRGAGGRGRGAPVSVLDPNAFPSL